MRELDGFVAWVASYVALGAILAWQFLPTEWLHAAGLSYLPSREWFAALLTLVGASVVLYAAGMVADALAWQPVPGSARCIADRTSRFADVRGPAVRWA